MNYYLYFKWNLVFQTLLPTGTLNYYHLRLNYLKIITLYLYYLTFGFYRRQNAQS